MCVTQSLRNVVMPHRLLHLPSLLDPLLYPNDKYNQPKIPKPTPVIERQAYQTPVPRDIVLSADPNRRRRLMDVVTSAQGDPSAASTTAVPVGGG